MTHINFNSKSTTFVLGLMGVVLFIASFILFGNLNPDFNFADDYISKLGATGELYAIWWNILGFGLVGVLQIGFGLSYGKMLNDRLTGILLAGFGVGLIFTAFPIDMEDSTMAISKVHIVGICLALAFWLFGLSRISYNVANHKSVRKLANITAVLIVASIIGFVSQLWSMPMTHRMVFGVVFSWTALTSIIIIYESAKKKQNQKSNF